MLPELLPGDWVIWFKFSKLLPMHITFRIRKTPINIFLEHTMKSILGLDTFAPVFLVSGTEPGFVLTKWTGLDSLGVQLRDYKEQFICWSAWQRRCWPWQSFSLFQTHLGHPRLGRLASGAERQPCSHVVGVQNQIMTSGSPLPPYHTAFGFILKSDHQCRAPWEQWLCKVRLGLTLRSAKLEAWLPVS